MTLGSRTSKQMTAAAPTILDKIVATKRLEIAAAKERRSLESLRGALPQAPPLRDFFAAVSRPGQVHLIAEVKRASPSKGLIRADFDPVEIAQQYAAHGASAISVLTDETYFQGHLDFLTAIRAAVDVPLLRKDFILDTYQLVEARLAGADAVLLIAECLDDCQLRKLHNEAVELGLTPLVELYKPENLPRVLQAGATLIGVNNRDLRTFVVDLDHSIQLRRQVPGECVFVSESGISTRSDVERLAAAGVDAILVGESLMRQPSISSATAQLVGVPNHPKN